MSKQFDREAFEAMASLRNIEDGYPMEREDVELISIVSAFMDNLRESRAEYERTHIRRECPPCGECVDGAVPRLIAGEGGQLMETLEPCPACDGGKKRCGECHACLAPTTPSGEAK